ncbi:hypothetical protein D3C75_664270 [compost metagenome]
MLQEVGNTVGNCCLFAAGHFEMVIYRTVFSRKGGIGFFEGRFGEYIDLQPVIHNLMIKRFLQFVVMDLFHCYSPFPVRK